MALSDLMLRARVNLALARDPRVGVLDVGVTATDGLVILEGDLDGEEECRAAEEIARSVDGVGSVENRLTCGVGKSVETAQLAVQRFLERLDDEWEMLPDARAFAQAHYLEWAVWAIHRFRVPRPALSGESDQLEADAIDQALTRVGTYVGASKAILAQQVLRLADTGGGAAPFREPQR